MATYAYEARTRGGEVRRGTVEATNEDMAVARLRADNLSPTRVKKQVVGLSGIQFGSGVSEKELVVFTRQFATMIDAGLPLVQCLDILATQAENKRFARVLADVKETVESGSTFSDALKRHPRVFTELYTNLIAAGEVGGILDTILQRLGTYIEKAMKLKRQVRGALVYPSAILAVAIGVIAVMLGKVIPVFQRMFIEMKAGALPAPTQVVINLSQTFIKYWYLFVIGAVAFLAGFVFILRNERTRFYFDGFILKVPLVGPVLRKIVVARFTRTLGTLLSAGVPILDALDVVAKTAGNKVIAQAIYFTRRKISEGKDMASPLAETGVFPPMVVQMIGVGEQTGAMDTMLQKIADFYEDEVDVAVAALTSMLEPIMMVFLGFLVGGLIIAMYLPIFELAGNIKAD